MCRIVRAGSRGMSQALERHHKLEAGGNHRRGVIMRFTAGGEFVREEPLPEAPAIHHAASTPAPSSEISEPMPKVAVSELDRPSDGSSSNATPR